MQPNDASGHLIALHAAGAGREMIRFGRAVAVALLCGTLFLPAASAEPSQEDEQVANASNGGVAMVTSGGEVTIDQIVTGENTGNAIVTGDISGPADISGGEIDYPTEVTVTLNEGPLVADATGGDEGAAATSADDGSSSDDDNDKDRKDEDDITIINRNENRNKSTLKK